MQKRFAALLAAFLIVPVVWLATALAHGGAANVVPNHSGETLDSQGVPEGWVFNHWGDLSAFGEVSDDSADGENGFHVSVSDHNNGDAKWYFEPVAIEAATGYDFSNQYKATAESEVVVQYSLEDGSVTYQWLGSNPAVDTWSDSHYSFTSPADAEKASVFHVLAQNGELWTDDFVLSEAEVFPVPQFANRNLEIPAVGMDDRPQSWTPQNWGDNQAVFEYLDEGFDDNHSVMVEITDYSSGDAKWIPEYIDLTPGQDYRFSNWYKSDITSRYVLSLKDVSGNISFSELKNASPSPDEWTKYSDTFTMPPDARSVRVYHLISSTGYLITDNFLVEKYAPQGFERGLLTLTFDDGWEENITTAIPMMEEYGFQSNQFYATQFIQNSYVDNPKEKLLEIRDLGHEIGSHTVSHPDLTTLTEQEVRYELRASQKYLQRILKEPINYFATPFGAYNDPVKDQIMSFYDVHRTVNSGHNSIDNWDITQLKVQNVLSTTTASEVQSWIEQAQTDGTWLILLYHRVGDDPGYYDIGIEGFADHLTIMNESGIEVVTISEALTELTPQLP